MRIPHLIDKNTLTAYSPSPESVNLLGERQRKITSENFAWNESDVRPLTDLSVEAISRHFEKLQLLDEMPCEDKAYLLEVLPVDLPLECVVPNIEDEFYWRRRFDSHFGPITRRKPPDWTWKSLYLERHVGRLLEEAEPQYADEESMDDVLKLCHAYVERLVVGQLQSWKPPLTMQKEDIPEVYPLDHINFTYVCDKLPNVTEFDLIFGMKVNMDSFENFNWNMFKISVTDCRRLGKALLDFKQLKVLRLHKSRLEYKHCQALMKGLIKNTSLIEVDLSHCDIGDKGALCVAKLMEVHPSLEVLNLCNNGIGQIGAEGIGFILVTSTSTKLRSLNLRLNPLLHPGTMGILRAIVRCELPLELNLSGCQFEEETPERISQMLRLNKTLKKLDVSNNWFGEEGGEFLVNALDQNCTLEWLDLRETDVTSDQEKTIRKLLARNRGESIEESHEDDAHEEEEKGSKKSTASSVKVDDRRVSTGTDEHVKSNVDV